MTPAEYADASRFPLTTQRGLSADKQLLIDAHNLDQLREYAEDNLHRLTPEDRALLAELEEKATVAPAVRAALPTG